MDKYGAGSSELSDEAADKFGLKRSLSCIKLTNRSHKNETALKHIYIHSFDCSIGFSIRRCCAGPVLGSAFVAMPKPLDPRVEDRSGLVGD